MATVRENPFVRPFPLVIFNTKQVKRCFTNISDGASAHYHARVPEIENLLSRLI